MAEQTHPYPTKMDMDTFVGKLLDNGFKQSGFQIGFRSMGRLAFFPLYAKPMQGLEKGKSHYIHANMGNGCLEVRQCFYNTEVTKGDHKVVNQMITLSPPAYINCEEDITLFRQTQTFIELYLKNPWL